MHEAARVVRAVREGNRDEMICYVASDEPQERFPALVERLEERLKEVLGVRLKGEVVAPGFLDEWTGINVAAKLIRFRDERE